MKIWLIIEGVCIMFLSIGIIKHSHLLIFTGTVGAISAIVCEGLNLIIQWIKKG